jgi:hypothetical protein
LSGCLVWGIRDALRIGGIEACELVKLTGQVLEALIDLGEPLIDSLPAMFVIG